MIHAQSTRRLFRARAAASATSLCLALFVAFAAACGGTTSDAQGQGEPLTSSGATVVPTGIAAASCDACGAGDLCVVTTDPGAPCAQPDGAGQCPSGTTYDSAAQCCANTAKTYACYARPSSCSPSLSCGCATDICDVACAPEFVPANTGPEGYCGATPCGTCTDAASTTVTCVCNAT